MLALQNHPPVIENHRDMLRMIAEVESPALKACLDAPRWKVDASKRVVTLDVEATVPPAVRAELAQMGHAIEAGNDTYMDFGAGQFIYKLDGDYLAASDPRRDGQAVGY